MNAPTRIRARCLDGVTEVLMLMPHPMETGLRKGDDGRFVPAHFITEVRVMAGDRVVLEARMSQAVARDPLVSFRFRGGRVGERLAVAWTDNRGQRRLDEALIA